MVYFYSKMKKTGILGSKLNQKIVLMSELSFDES